METSLEQKTSITTIQIENARVGYQVAIQMWSHSGDEVWARFNVMLVAHSIILAIIGLLFISNKVMPILNIFFPILGIVLCFLWFVLFKRGFDYIIYYLFSARELEEQYLTDPVKTLSRGGTFGKGETVSLEIDGTVEPRRMSSWSRLLRAYRASYIVIIIFGIVYSFILLHAVL